MRRPPLSAEAVGRREPGAAIRVTRTGADSPAHAAACCGSARRHRAVARASGAIAHRRTGARAFGREHGGRAGVNANLASGASAASFTAAGLRYRVRRQKARRLRPQACRRLAVSAALRRCCCRRRRPPLVQPRSGARRRRRTSGSARWKSALCRRRRRRAPRPRGAHRRRAHRWRAASAVSGSFRPSGVAS